MAYVCVCVSKLIQISTSPLQTNSWNTTIFLHFSLYLLINEWRTIFQKLRSHFSIDHGSKLAAQKLLHFCTETLLRLSPCDERSWYWHHQTREKPYSSSILYQSHNSNDFEARTRRKRKLRTSLLCRIICLLLATHGHTTHTTKPYHVAP